MEPAEGKVRYRLIMGKYPIVKVEKNLTGFVIVLQFPENIKVGMQVPPNSDVREGDILTVYTEILTNAQPITPSIQ